ncbi:MAG: hypothetical protein A3J24_00700 [Deltaproteobacteria bacterium RIFCSPLOWO2_02_FULL_53_8]|nr:MAG: hypothetical protein A3J24_00700 [Deltaproteobacteria bacterium RIFCSPLOWO2_02_FULL_53_8]
MGTYLAIIPIAMLVTYSQLIVKWRSSAVNSFEGTGFIHQLTKFMTDPVVLSAYAAALLASFAWLFIVTKLPLTIAFPIYIGITFVMVLLGGQIFLGETMNTTKILAISLILVGIALGVNADA